MTGSARELDEPARDHSPDTDPAIVREIAHLQRRTERPRSVRDRAHAQYDQRGAELRRLKLEQEIGHRS